MFSIINELEGYGQFSQYLNGIDLEMPVSPEALLIPTLNKCQELFSFIPAQAIKDIAYTLEMSEEVVQAAIDEHPYFTKEVKQQVRVNVCGGPVCYQRGSYDIYDDVCKHLNIENEVSSDGKICIKKSLCQGNCASAPVATINGKSYNRIEKEEFLKQVDKEIEDSKD